jgi:hypothetical protein
VVVPRTTGHRLICANANVADMAGRISDLLRQGGLGIQETANRSRGDLVYMVIDLNATLITATLVSQCH